MRTFAFLLLVAVAVTAKLALPASRAVDWPAVQNQVKLIRTSLINANNSVVNALQNVDAENILKNLNNTATTVKSIIVNQLEAHSEDQTLTKIQAIYAVGITRERIRAFGKLIANDLAAIPPEIANQVRDTLDNVENDLIIQGGQLNELLST